MEQNNVVGDKFKVHKLAQLSMLLAHHSIKGGKLINLSIKFKYLDCTVRKHTVCFYVNTFN